MPFPLPRLVERLLNRLRLTQMPALIGAVLGLPLFLLLFGLSTQFWRWGEAEARAARHVHRLGAFTQLLHQLARRGDFGLEPCPDVLCKSPETLKTLDEEIHHTLMDLEFDVWDRAVFDYEQDADVRQFLTNLRKLPSLPTDVSPSSWREKHFLLLTHLTDVIVRSPAQTNVTPGAETPNEIVERLLSHELPTFVVRLSAVSELGPASSRKERTAKPRFELFVNVGRLRQAQENLSESLDKLETGHRQVYAEFGSELRARLQALTVSLNHVETRATGDPSAVVPDAEVLWREQVGIRNATERAAESCATNLESRYRIAADRWRRAGQGLFALTVVIGASAWLLILGLQAYLQRFLQTLRDLSQISPTGDVLHAVSIPDAPSDLNEIIRNFRRAVTLLQTNNTLAQEAARRAVLGEMSAKRSEEQFALMASASKVGLWDWDTLTDCVHLSQHAWRLLGYRPENTPQTSFAGFVDLIHPEDRQTTINALDAHIETRNPFDCEFRLRNLLGEYRWVHATGQAKWDVTNRPVRMAGSLSDVTERRQLEEDRSEYIAELKASRDQIATQAAKLLQQTDELRHTQKLAEDASRSKTEFLANMSHELRTPLTAILGYSDLLYEEGDLARAPKARLDMIDTIRINGRHLLQLIDDILDLSKIEAGKMNIESVPCRPEKILDEVRRLFELRAKTKGLEFEVRAQGLLPSVFLGDPVRLRQILVNLLGNAIKFTEKGTVALELSAVPGPRAELTFTVTDTGIGMSPEQLSRLFEPFGQADASTTRKFGGTGLGLSISRRLADLLNGDISVTSEAGRGSSFTVKIFAEVPREATWQAYETRSSPSVAVIRPTTEPTSVLDGARILIADDVEPNRRLIAFVLTKANAIVTFAVNGDDAIEKVTKAEQVDQPYDIVLMDMQMPVLNGYAATRQLRHSGYRGPIIAMTACAMAPDRQECLDAGCDDYLTKPIDRNALLEVCTHYRFAVQTIPATAR